MSGGGPPVSTAALAVSAAVTAAVRPSLSAMQGRTTGRGSKKGRSARSTICSSSVISSTKARSRRVGPAGRMAVREYSARTAATAARAASGTRPSWSSSALLPRARTTSARARHASAARRRSLTRSNHGHTNTPARVDTAPANAHPAMRAGIADTRRRDAHGQHEGEEHGRLCRRQVATEDAGEGERETDHNHHRRADGSVRRHRRAERHQAGADDRRRNVGHRTRRPAAAEVGHDQECEASEHSEGGHLQVADDQQGHRKDRRVDDRRSHSPMEGDQPRIRAFVGRRRRRRRPPPALSGRLPGRSSRRQDPPCHRPQR